MDHPAGIDEVPLHGLADAGVKGLGGFPARFAFALARIDGEAAVVAGAVGHIGDLFLVWLAIGERTQLVKQRADGVHNIQIGLLLPATDVVDFTQAARLEHASDGAAVVLDIQPVANSLAVAIDRQRFAGDRIHNHQRDELFG